MLIVGGGVIGCEMACLYAVLGTKVTVVEALDRLLPAEDAWVGRLLAREFRKLEIDVITSQKVAAVEKTGSAAVAALEDGRRIEGDKILVAVGRRPTIDAGTVESLGLEMNGAAVAVDEGMQTSAEAVFAIGDVVGTTYLAHGAFAEAEVAAANAAGGSEKMADYALIPRAVYSFPEVASVGRTEQRCSREGLDVVVGRSSFIASARSAAEGQTAGEIRAVRDKATSQVLGVTMVGATVTEHIAAARALLGTREKITAVSFPHPTASEVLKEAWEDAFGESVHNPPRKTA
jgi:dihydrolipoamide dehydrogenase